MNYDLARQLGPESDAPGKWNWTSMNDRVISTASPCAYPDFDWESVPLDVAVRGEVGPTGRKRCDHDTREEAERHYHDHRLSRIVFEPFDEATARERRRCVVKVGGAPCPNWQTAWANWRDGWLIEPVCDDHANAGAMAAANPFSPGAEVIHS